LQCQSKLEIDKLNRLWILIPYDRNGLEKLWQTTEKNGDEIKTNVANSMMEKRFQIRFSVPPIILSNWEEYFQKQLRNALPDHDKKEFYSAYRIFYYYLNKKIDYKTIQNPTPRQIKIFINQIGTLHRQWVDKIPLAQMAYFICLQNNKEKIQKILLNGEMPDKEIQFYLGEEILENLSSMWFNVDQKIAFQTLLQAPIESLIINRNFVELSNLASAHGNIFWVIFSKLPINHWGNTAPLNLANIAYFLLQGSNLILQEFNSRDSFISTLVQNAKEVEEWKPFTEQMSDGLSSLFLLKPDRTFAINIIEKIVRTECGRFIKHDIVDPIETSELNKIQEEITTFSSGLIRLIDNNELKIVEYLLKEPLELIIDSYQFIEICSNFAYKDPDKKMWDVFVTNNDPNDVSSAFVSIINGSNISKRHVGAIQVMLRKMPDIPFFNIAEAISERVKDLNTENVSELLECLWILNENENVRTHQIILSLIQSGSIANHLILKFDKLDFLCCSWCIFLLMAFDPGLTIQQNKRGPEGIAKLKEIFNNPEDPQFIEILENLENIISLYTSLDFVIDFYRNNSESLNLVSVLLLDFTKMEKPEIFFTGEIINNNWEEIINIIGIEQFNILISNVIKNDELLIFTKSNFSRDKAGLYNIIIKSIVTINQYKDFSKWLCQNIQIISKEEWLAGFKAETEIVSLLLTLINKNVQINLGIPFIDAYVEYSNLVIVGEIKPEKFLTEWEKLPQSLTNKTYKKTLILKIIDNLKDNQNGIASEFFDIYGNLINQPELLMDNVDIVRKLFTRLIEIKNIRGLEWLSNLFITHPKILSKNEENEGVIYFKDLLRNSLNQSNEESIQKNLEQIALVLGIEKHSQETSEEIQEDSSSN